jgi:hypothetical protein
LSGSPWASLRGLFTIRDAHWVLMV